MQPTSRKLRDRIATIKVKLTESEIQDRRQQVMSRMDAKDALREKLKSFKSDIKARNDLLDQEIAVLRSEQSTGEAAVEIGVADFLMPNNEVVSIRIDTEEVVGRRSATAKELQEDLDLQDDDGFGGGAH